MTIKVIKTHEIYPHYESKERVIYFETPEELRHELGHARLTHISDVETLTAVRQELEALFWEARLAPLEHDAIVELLYDISLPPFRLRTKELMKLLLSTAHNAGYPLTQNIAKQLVDEVKEYTKQVRPHPRP